MKHIRSYKIFESIEIDTIKDYFSDLFDEGFEITEIKKVFTNKNCSASHPFQGCTHINYTLKIRMQSDTYTNYQDEYLSAIERCAEAEGLELANFTTQHKLSDIVPGNVVGNLGKKKYHYYLEVQFKEPFTEEVDIKVQNMQDFEKQLNINIEWYTRNTSFKRHDFNIEKKENDIVITTLSGIDTPNKFRTVSNWFTEGALGIESDSMMFRKMTGTYFKYDIDIQRPRFEGRRVISPGIITITNLK